ncbi:MAG: tRNA (guanosine(37)-N1)-methyltransferase TrmD, partial [Buchnera aphidicola]|nr:tRNA (guanosine(37)-N1)-methyltransferase TrmD [Buchnera aphidicola]
MFNSITQYGVTGRAIKNNIINVNFLNLRDFSENKNKSIDDRPYGGGPGMLISAPPLFLAIKKAKYNFKKSTVIYLSPQGIKLNHNNIINLINKKRIIFI